MQHLDLDPKPTPAAHALPLPHVRPAKDPKNINVVDIDPTRTGQNMTPHRPENRPAHAKKDAGITHKKDQNQTGQENDNSLNTPT